MRIGAVWVALGLSLSGCREAPEEPGSGEEEPEEADPGEGRSRAVPVFHPPDVAEPRETWKDPPSGMLFTTPDLGWTRLAGDELTGLGPDVRLAVREGPHCVGWVRVAPDAGRHPKELADAMRATLGWEGLDLHVDEDVKYDLWTARRYEVQGRLQGRVQAERTTVWRDSGVLYAVVARSDEGNYTARRRCLDRVTAGFALGSPAP